MVAARDAMGRPWRRCCAASRASRPSLDETTLILAARPVPGDALDGAFTGGAPLGLLGIELETRRRNRVNGTVTSSGKHALMLAVDQAFGNCPQYISTRERKHTPFITADVRAERLDRLDGHAHAAIAAADTLFVASGYAGGRAGTGDASETGPDVVDGMDASHRGGARGVRRDR